MSEKIRRPDTQIAANSEGQERPRRTVEFLIDGEVKSFDREAVKHDFGVDNIVRIQPSDFPNIIPAPGWRFVHFNIEKSDNVPGLLYLIVKIERGGVGREPLLSLDGALMAECVEAKSNVPYEAITAEQFAESLPGLKDLSSTLDVMAQRYGESRGLSREEVEAAGVGLTIFRIVGPAPASRVAR